MVAIAHKLKTIRSGGHIPASGSGRKAEEGTHDELMALNSLYATMQKLQSHYGEGYAGDAKAAAGV